MANNEKVSYQIDITGNALDQLDKIKKAWDSFNTTAGTGKVKTTVDNIGGTGPAPKQKDNSFEPKVKAAMTVRQEFMAARKALLEMDAAGEGGSRAFMDMAKKAGRLKDSIGDTAELIKTFAVGNNFEYGINLAKASFEGLNASAQIATGAMALFGYENDNVTKSIQQMMALQSLANGVKTLYNVLTKEGIIVTSLMSLKTGIAAGVQSFYTIAVGASTGALKAFKVALATTGIGALVIAVGYLATKLWDMKEKQDAANKAILDGAEADKTATEARNEKLKAIIETNKTEIENSKEKNKQLIIDNLEAEGKIKEAQSLRVANQLENIKIIEDATKKSRDVINKTMDIDSDYTLKDIKAEMQAVYGNTNNAWTAMVGTYENNIEKLKNAKEELKAIQLKGKEEQKATAKKLENKTTLINAAPKTFNVRIDTLVKIEDQNIMNGQDADSFTTMLKNNLINALASISMQAQ
jgi:NAD(P)-dependent dehydrogenase (short-subunit alcohol dehydrogenase family)